MEQIYKHLKERKKELELQKPIIDSENWSRLQEVIDTLTFIENVALKFYGLEVKDGEFRLKAWDNDCLIEGTELSFNKDTRKWETFTENENKNMILTEKEKQALKQARKLKAFRIRSSKDNENTFSDIYYHIQHEVNLYNNKAENNQLTKSSANSAKVWLSRYAKII